jgi:hypothetical protein
MMEACFRADKGTTRKLYGFGATFKENALAKNPKVEQIPRENRKTA